MEFLTSLSDDQKAVAGCVAVLLFSGVLLSLGNWIGSKVRGDSSRPVLRLPENYRETDNRDQSSGQSTDRAA